MMQCGTLQPTLATQTAGDLVKVSMRSVATLYFATLRARDENSGRGILSRRITINLQPCAVTVPGIPGSPLAGAG